MFFWLVPLVKYLLLKPNPKVTYQSMVRKYFPSRDSNPWPWSRWGLDDQKTLMGTNIRRFSINRFRHFSVRLFFDPELEQAIDLDDDDDDEKRFARLSQHVISWLVTQQFAKRQFADIQIANYFNFLALSEELWTGRLGYLQLSY